MFQSRVGGYENIKCPATPTETSALKKTFSAGTLSDRLRRGLKRPTPTCRPGSGRGAACTLQWDALRSRHYSDAAERTWNEILIVSLRGSMCRGTSSRGDRKVGRQRLETDVSTVTSPTHHQHRSSSSSAVAIKYRRIMETDPAKQLTGLASIWWLWRVSGFPRRAAAGPPALHGPPL